MVETLKAKLYREYIVTVEAKTEALNQRDRLRSQFNEIRSQLDDAENKADEAIAACNEAYNDFFGKAS